MSFSFSNLKVSIVCFSQKAGRDFFRYGGFLGLHLNGSKSQFFIRFFLGYTQYMYDNT